MKLRRTRPPGRIAGVMVVAVAGLLAPGCNSVGPGTWRHRVSEHVAERAHGDPNALRRMRTAGGRRGFTVIGGPDPASSTDVVGLLLGHRVLRGEPWFFYLVGTVEGRELTGARLTAAHWEDGRFRWVVGGPDPEALEKYREALKRRKPAWRSDEAPFAGSYRGWPREGDDYELRIGRGRIIAREAGSGARWTLPLEALSKERNAKGAGRPGPS